MNKQNVINVVGGEKLACTICYGRKEFEDMYVYDCFHWVCKKCQKREEYRAKCTYGHVNESGKNMIGRGFKDGAYLNMSDFPGKYVEDEQLERIMKLARQ